jgi:hypothetical protein
MKGSSVNKALQITTYIQNEIALRNDSNIRIKTLTADVWCVLEFWRIRQHVLIMTIYFTWKNPQQFIFDGIKYDIRHIIIIIIISQCMSLCTFIFNLISHNQCCEIPNTILVRTFSRLESNVQLRLSGMSRVECWKQPNVSANTATALLPRGWILLHFITLTIFHEQNTLLSSALCIFSILISLPLSSVQIFTSPLRSQTLKAQW